MLKENAHIFGDDVNTDYIVSGKYRAKPIPEMAMHCMEELDPAFAARVQQGDFLVAGHNFGSGSSREYAPRVLIEVGISCVLAKSFARIFYRNAINMGLLAIEMDTGGIDNGDRLEADIENGRILNQSKDWERSFQPIPQFMMQIIQDGGLAAHFRKHGGFDLPSGEAR